MRQIALILIRWYQRHLSPRKGFCCAYRQYTGRASCSQLGLRVIARFGLLRGYRVLRERLHRCGIAHRQMAAWRPLRQQRGECDLPCDASCDIPCDAPRFKSCPWMDLLECGNACSCDGTSRRKPDPVAENKVRRAGQKSKTTSAR